MSSRFLKKPTVPPRVKPQKKVSTLLDEMQGLGFQGKNLAQAHSIWREMLQEKKITIWLGITGAIVPAGLRRVLAYLIEQRMVDVIVSTGAQLFHDACECLGVRHFQGSALLDDLALQKAGVDRFHDILVKEDLQRKVDRQIQAFIGGLEANYQYSSRQFFELFGKYLDKVGTEKDSILVQAARQGVPVFAPALNDSSIGYSFVMARHGVKDSPDGKNVVLTENSIYRFVDQFKDTDETAQIAAASKKSGVIYLGGGVPKNFIQQVELLNVIMGKNMPGHEYAVQITTDNPNFGGLSGCTFEEAQSWGKISAQAKKVQCFCDVTIALPFLANGLADSGKIIKARRKPKFDWSKPRQVKVTYK